MKRRQGPLVTGVCDCLYSWPRHRAQRSAHRFLYLLESCIQPDDVGSYGAKDRAWGTTMHVFEDSGHLFRLAAVVAAGVLLFLVIRGFMVPKSFGQYGHYRGNAIAEIAGRRVRFAGHETCETCHAEVLEKKKSGKHVHVNCEACHGPLAEHADDPASVQPPKLDTAVLCVRCHEANAAKPKGFPQVASAEHSTGLACDTCHQPHSPAIESPAIESPAISGETK